MAEKRDKSRVLGLDILRGLALINMLAYHFLYDLVYIFGGDVSWFRIRTVYPWQQAICITFILVAGISFTLSGNHCRRFLILALCAATLTVVTLIVIPSEQILFGIIHFMALATLLTALLKPLLSKIPAPLGLALALTFFILLRRVPAGYIGFFSWFSIALPETLYETPFLFFLGFPRADFASADYFPLIPWWFLYLTGFFGAKHWLALSDKGKAIKSPFIKKSYRFFDMTLGAAGRYSLVVYMLHQPIIYGGLYLYFLVF